MQGEQEVFLDTETTGFSPASGARIVEIAIVDRSGRALVDTLIDPGSEIPWQSTKIHGITDDMVRGKPKLSQIMPTVLQAITGSRVVIYNARFDTAFFPDGLQQADGIECAMAAFARALGCPVRKLSAAADHVGHQWSGQAHRALADALACRSIWLWLSESASVRRR